MLPFDILSDDAQLRRFPPYDCRHDLAASATPGADLFALYGRALPHCFGRRGVSAERLIVRIGRVSTGPSATNALLTTMPSKVQLRRRTSELTASGEFYFVFEANAASRRHRLTVLDVGCGAGTQALAWAREGHRAQGSRYLSTLDRNCAQARCGCILACVVLCRQRDRSFRSTTVVAMWCWSLSCWSTSLTGRRASTSRCVSCGREALFTFRRPIVFARSSRNSNCRSMAGTRAAEETLREAGCDDAPALGPVRQLSSGATGLLLPVPRLPGRARRQRKGQVRRHGAGRIRSALGWSSALTSALPHCVSWDTC